MPGAAMPTEPTGGAMTGTDDLRGREYAALMDQARDLERTAQWTWTGTAIAAAVLLSSAISARSAGLMLPVVLCTAFGYYANLSTRRRCRLVAGYVQEFFETDRTGAQWHTRLAHLASTGTQDNSEWMPLLLSNLVTLTSVVLGWVFAEGSSRGDLMGGFTTLTGVAFAVHSIVESMRSAQIRESTDWSQFHTPLREGSSSTAERRSGT